MKKAEKEELGDNHVSEDVEKVGWGVEKAQESYHADASKSTRSARSILFLFSLSRCLVLGLETRLVPAMAGVMKSNFLSPQLRQSRSLSNKNLRTLYGRLGSSFKVLD